MDVPARFNPRIGFHYYPDTLHYRQIDLDTWLPELHALGASWLALVAPATRAIPESFIAGLLQAGIQPLLHFPFRCAPASAITDGGYSSTVAGIADPGVACDCPPLDTLRLLLGSYARWGVKHVVFFDRPNCRTSWPPSAWLQGDLVERFLDLFQPLAALALDAGLSPALPPLAPGGDYWDLAFLRAALRGLQQRDPRLLESLALSAEAWVGERPLVWGAGGPQKWPGSRPYQAASPGQPPSEDHLGFHIYDWYLAACRQEIGRTLPLFLLRMGQRRTGVALEPVAGIADPGSAGETAITAGGDNEPGTGAALAAGIQHARQNLEVAQMLAGAEADPAAQDSAEALPSLPAQVVAGCFWLLAAERGAAGAAEAWYPPAGQVVPAAGALRQWIEYVRAPSAAPVEPVAGIADPGAAGETAITAGGYNGEPGAGVADPASVDAPAITAGDCSDGDYHPSPLTQPKSINAIAHYVLLPVYAWGVANWDLALIQPILNGAHPTIGFSLAEARLARRVTVVGGPGSVSAEALAMLRRSGCQVERLLEDGTVVAT